MNNKMAKVNKFIFWTPRILSILFILFLAMFSLDVFGNGYSFWETVVGLFMHNLPSMILLVILIISWKHEIVGGITFIFAGLLYTLLIAVGSLKGPFEWYMFSYSMIIAGPAFFIGILFLIGWRMKQKRKTRFNKK